MSPRHELLALLAENLRSNFVRLSARILEHKTHRPEWKVLTAPITPLTPEGKLVEELQEILALAVTLDGIVLSGAQPTRGEGS